jgi:hypothetical protein
LVKKYINIYTHILRVAATASDRKRERESRSFAPCYSSWNLVKIAIIILYQRIKRNEGEKAQLSGLLASFGATFESWNLNNLEVACVECDLASKQL